MRRVLQLIKFGWLHAGEIKNMDSNLNRVQLFLDILYCYGKYGMWSNQYLNQEFYKLGKTQRESIGLNNKKNGIERDLWQKEFRNNIKFINKYSNRKYERYNLRDKRNKAYAKKYNAGKNLFVEHSVAISRQHYLPGTIKIGHNVTIAKHCFIDYSGNIIIGDNVGLAMGVIIESHSHQRGIFNTSQEKKIIQKDIIIEENVKIGANAIILETTGKIGRYANIGAGTVVRKPVPPYSMVIGNPAKIVGFFLTPQHMKIFEEKNYPIEARTNMEEYTKLYDNFFKSKIENISEYTGLTLN